MSARPYPYAFHVALDGNGLNGLEGMAGVCLFLYDPEDHRYAYKVKYYDGVSAGHAVSVNPDRTVGFLGNAGQQLLFYDARTLEELQRVSTLRFEASETTLRGSTHVVWLDAHRFITAIGAHLWLLDLRDLSRGERLAPHRVRLPHGMKKTASGRWVAYGSMDHPHLGEAREVGLLDLGTGETRRVELPTTCWHLACHPRRDVFYPISFRVHPQGGRDWHEWAMAFLKEYAYEIDAGTGQVLRHWSAGRETPAHINSDVCVSDRELIFCNGGSQTVVCVDLETLASHRLIDERPGALETLARPRQVATQVFDAFARGGVFESARHFVGALRVSRGSLLDSVYACQLSRDQRLLFTANRGLNHVTVYDYPSLTLRLRVPMPGLQAFAPGVGKAADPRLGFHHSVLVG
ncbi:MAG: hypothetical protein QM767_19395 [Anaeromyxobacter sp.]